MHQETNWRNNENGWFSKGQQNFTNNIYDLFSAFLSHFFFLFFLLGSAFSLNTTKKGKSKSKSFVWQLSSPFTVPFWRFEAWASPTDIRQKVIFHRSRYSPYHFRQPKFRGNFRIVYRRKTRTQNKRKICTGRESNPGLYRGRVLFYH